MADYKLLSIVMKILNEVGDLKNIQPFNWSQSSANAYSFDIIDDVEVDILAGKVFFQSISQNDRNMIKFSPAIEIEKVPVIENVSYSVEGKTDQYMKSNFSLLIQIIKTVSDIVDHRIQQHPDTAFIFFEETKIGGTGNAQKIRLYQAILTKNLIPGYRGSKIGIGNLEGYCISPINK
jgi:hypothetical protein